MDINSSPAGFADPAFTFGFNELTDAVFLYRFKVFDHAHAILFSVSIVQLLQPFAREICTRVMVSRTFSQAEIVQFMLHNLLGA